MRTYFVYMCQHNHSNTLSIMLRKYFTLIRQANNTIICLFNNKARTVMTTFCIFLGITIFATALLLGKIYSYLDPCRGC